MNGFDGRVSTTEGETVKILVVDDDMLILKLIENYLTKLGYRIYTCKTGNEAFKIVDNEDIDIVLLDLVLPDMNGLNVLKRIKDERPEVSVAMMTGYGSVETAVTAMQYGAENYLLKPFKSIEELKYTIEKIIKYQRLRDENIYLKEQLNLDFNISNIVGKSKPMIEIFKIIKKVAPMNSTVLIEGESGTGKELIARAIHQNSSRASERFIAINCGAIPSELLESELFGYEKGAFTGANHRKKGYFEVANNGTILLDEISELPLSLQVKLLRVLQELSFQRVGGTEEIKIDVRVIASTNKDLEEEVNRGNFRKDLYYRINVIKIKVPPLRERKEDIPLLVDYFIKKYSKEFGKAVKGITRKAMNILMDYDWDGNVRELQNVIQRGIILTDKNVITENEIPEYIFSREKIIKPIFTLNIQSYKEAKNEFERRYFENLLKITNGNILKASKISGIPRQNIYNKLKKHRIALDLYR